jgi:hypothetical protein
MQSACGLRIQASCIHTPDHGAQDGLGMRPGHAAASPINPKSLVSSSVRTLCRNARFSLCLPSRIVTVAQKPKPPSVAVSAINAVAACTLALTYEWQRDGRSSIPRCHGNYTCRLLEKFVPRCDQWVPLSQISSNKARRNLSPNPMTSAR